MWKAGERKVTMSSESQSPLWIQLLEEERCHHQPPQFSKRKLPPFTLSCSSSSTKHCFPANKTRHNFLHAVCGDSVISLAGSQAHTGQELQGALCEPSSLPALSLYFYFFLPQQNSLSLILPLLSIHLFIYSLNVDLFRCPAISGKQKEALHFWEKAVNGLAEGEANGTFLNKAAGSIAHTQQGLWGKLGLLAKEHAQSLGGWVLG